MSDYEGTRLSLRGHQGSDFRLVQTFESHGSSRSQAVENARMVEYNVSLQDSILTFDEDIRFKENAVFRGQRLNMILYIPYDAPFMMEEDMKRIISSYIPSEDVEGYRWRMTRDGLECINCNDSTSKTFSNLRDFDQVEISGKFDLRIQQGHTYSVEMNGPEQVKKLYSIRRTGETLVIDFERQRDDEKWENWDVRGLSLDAMEIIITMPALEKLEAMGLGTVKFDDINGHNLEIDARGPVKIRGDLNVEELTIRLNGKSEADLSGNVGNMNARVEFASRLRAYELETRDAFVEVQGASSAKVNVRGRLEMDEGIASDIDYRGNPEIVRHD
jgi:hypothetical protein